MVQTWIIAGGATRPPCPAATAAPWSVQTGLVSPMASIQFLIIGRFTGSRPARGLLSPAAVSRSAAARIAAASPVAACVAVICVPPSARHPGQPEPGRCDQLPLDLVDPAAEGQHGVPLGLHVQPPGQAGGVRVGRVAVPGDDLLELLAEPL